MNRGTVGRIESGGYLNGPDGRLAGRRGEVLFVAIAQSEVRAEPSKRDRDGFPDAHRRSGHEGDATRKTRGIRRINSTRSRKVQVDKKRNRFLVSKG